ncbi:hypothetical protein [Noviherbaspirillum malthae]|uniref:hypothetical protein n=1 Tax=Noviherbaspirillum malthae TaxID=1260987 RepID=UPI00189058A9|nr:hypothetical protein [Noviherbaspirillum malthae]
MLHTVSIERQSTVARRPLRKGEQLKEKVDKQLADIQERPELVRSFFNAPSVAYIRDC